MSQNITLIRIFVSCPGDVEEEKKVVEELCQLVNNQLTQQNCPLLFQVCEWKQIIGEHGDRPQEIINNRIIYDIYLGIFWNRFGTPTGELNQKTGELFGSGTEEEYYLALKKWEQNKEAMLMYVFFKKQSDAANDIQPQKVLQFKKDVSDTGWVNEFDRTEQFKDKINSILFGITVKFLIANDKRNFKLNGQTSLEYIGELKKLFEKTVVPLQYYIPRKIRKVNEGGGVDAKSLMEGTRCANKMVVLGNAGAGKSIALQQLGREVLDSISPLIPIYQRFNTYVDKDLEEILPEQWKEADPENLLLLLDGIDEVPPDHFTTVIRKIQGFSEKHSKIRIIVSCRTNFYNLPSDTESGNLKGFDCYFLSDLTEDDVREYVTSVFQMDGTRFITEADKHGFIDIIFNPFFLNLLLTYYKDHHNLEADRAFIIRQCIESRIKFDQRHFETTLELDLSKKEILKTAGKVALAMELMGRNHILDDELYEIIKPPDQRKALRYFSAFNKSVQTTESWQFEHNNIREYLAAYLLADQPLDLLKSLASFAPDFNRIKPNWANTLSFLLNIGDGAETEQLINWLMEKDPEMIVKTERERVDPAVRLLIFKRIFEFYKEKQIWLQSNKFKTRELATFGESQEAIQYLIHTFNDEALAKVVRLNALDLLEEMDMGKYPSYLPDLERTLMSSLEKEQSDVGFVHSVLSAMGTLGMNGKETLSAITSLFSNRSNQYIRAGLYKIIWGSDYLNDYVDLFLEGVFMTNEDEWNKDRGEVNLADESFYLNRGLKKFNSSAAIKRILGFFTDPLDRRHMHYYDKYEVIAAVVDNACEAYQEDKSVYPAIYAFFITTGRTFDSDYCITLSTFFHQTGTNVQTFNEVWNNAELKHYEKDSLIARLTDQEVLVHFVKGVEDGVYSNQDAERFHEALTRNKSMNAARNFSAELEQLLEERCHILLERLELPDYKAQQLAQKQRDFDLLFDKEKFLTEVSSFFNATGLQALTDKDVRRLRTEKLLATSDSGISNTIYDFLRDLTHQKAWSLAEVRAWVDNDKLFDNYRILEIYRHVKSDAQLSLSDVQKTFMINRCIALSKDIDWGKIAWVKEGAKESTFSYNRYAAMLWYFVRRLSIRLPEEMLLEFTLFEDFNADLPERSLSHIKFLEEMVDSKTLQDRVVKNIKEGIKISLIWRSNAKYAIANDLKEAFPHILDYIKTRDKVPEYIRAEILEVLFEKMGDTNAVLDVLTHSESAVIQWRCVEYLFSNKKQEGLLTGFLQSILVTEPVPNERGLKAAGYLVALNCLDGLVYYLKYLSSGKTVPFDLDHARRCFSKVMNVEAVPLLMDLLQVTLGSEHRSLDYFDRFDPLILEALHQVAISSEEGLEEVRTSLTTFIKESPLPNFNYLYTSIARMEEAYYLGQSQSLSIKAVIQCLKALE
ncbi:NACHT domain-containing protein [Arachidicoccus terrestris]|uniref:NACHT domain-containing protein n=1 Tax=Arachidicoccus terrestris TaxID=2875539 RepID=UPI001CC4177D|nr:hypothetical protein [Arachidicoccus terrestris]UAY55748.1 hypothetical protein K9M52_01560 [Arachidicoccus terrestris]